MFLLFMFSEIFPKISLLDDLVVKNEENGNDSSIALIDYLISGYHFDCSNFFF